MLRLSQDYSGWFNILSMTGVGVYTFLLVSHSTISLAQPLLIEQSTSRTPETIFGQLSTTSPRLEDDGSYYETFTFKGTAGETLTFELISNDFDAYLILVHPKGEWIAQDDDGAGGTNSQITTTLPTNGTYTLIINSYRANEIGNYSLRLQPATESVQGRFSARTPLEQAAQLSHQVFELHQMGRYDEAVALAERDLTITEQRLGLNHPDTALVMYNLAELYRLTDHYEDAEPLLQRSLNILEQQLGSDHPYMARSLSSLGLLYESLRRYEDAEPLLHRALDVIEQSLGPDHPDTAATLNNLARLYESTERYEDAETLYQRALNIFEQQLGPEHPNTAAALHNLASLYESLERHAEAEPLYRSALSITEQQLGEEHPNTVTSLNALARLYEYLERYTEAEPLYQRVLDIRERQSGPDHPDTAISLNDLALLYSLIGRYTEAEPLYQRALDIRERQLGPGHPDTATSLNNLAGLYELLGRYTEAESLHQRALEISEQQLGPDHIDTATSLNNLAGLYELLGRYIEAESLHQRALEINEQQLGPDHIDTATSLNNLASLYQSMGRYTEAEPLFQRALVIVEQQLGSDHSTTAKSLNNLATLYFNIGRYIEALPLFQRAHDIDEQQLGLDHPDMAISLNNLAALYVSAGSYVEAESLHQRALDIREQQLGPDHPRTATSLNNLATLYAILGRYAEAEPLYRRSLDIREQQVGPDHVDTAMSLANLASLYQSMERYVDAEPLFKRALTIFEQQDHPYAATILNNLAGLFYVQEKLQTTLNYLSQGMALEEIFLSRNLVSGSDANKRDYLATMAGTTYGVISLHLNDLPSDTAAAQLAFATVLQRKGRILDLFTNLRAQLADNPEALSLLDELNIANTQLSNFTFNLQDEFLSDTHREQRNVLQKKIRDLEDEISRRSTDFANITASPEVEDIQAALPSETTLVEFIRYFPLNPTGSDQERFGDPRYAAYVLPANGTVQGIDLGPAEAIDKAVSALSTSLASSDTPLAQVKEEAQTLEMLVMAPVRESLGEMTTIFISPDGALNLIPFEALVDESGNYLVKTYQFRYLTSGRDLMRLDNPAAGNNPALLIGNPTYGRPGELGAQPYNRSIDFKNRIFPALRGTQTEVNLIASKLDNAEVYTQTNATETVLKQQAQPSILHIATHGFFETFEEAANPLLQSGLILAGAAAGGQSGPDQDGILTALEITGMNLRGTQLVVLSACETGLGELAAREGVYGLRRALVLAGSQSQVISLWKVDDTATQELMVNYYDRLLSGTPRDVALRETQQAFLYSDEYSHPYYWAAFISSGDWRPLQE